MKFRFKLDKVLQHKSILEKQAQRDFAEASQKLDEQRNLLKNFELKLKNTYNERYALVQGSSGQNAMPVAASLDYVQKAFDGYKVMIQNQTKIVLGFEKILEEKRQRLIEDTKDRKIFEKLKEKKLEEFTKEKKRKDQKVTDETNSQRANQRGRI